ncbi:MAG: M50 family metallopeptidase [Acidimicrobiales bacterium]
MTDLETQPPPEHPPLGAGGRDKGPTPAPQPKMSLLLIVGLVVLLGLSGGWSILVVVAAIIVMIFLHELGHYLTAKWAGMKVTEFFLGFGPKVWSFQRGETEYGIKAIPAGAYVRVIGMNNLEEVAPEDEPKTYRQQPFWRRLSVAVAGSTMHFLLALVCLWALLVFHGAPGGTFAQSDADYRASTAWVIGSVSDGSAARAAGLRDGDKITAIDGQPVGAFQDLRDVIEPNAGKIVELRVLRDGTSTELAATLGTNPDGSGHGFLGVGPTVPNEKAGPIAGIGRSFGEFFAIGRESIGALGDRFSPSGLADLGSRVAEGGSNDQGPVVADPNPSSPNNTGSSSSSSSSDDGQRFISLIGAAQIGSELTRGGWAGLAIFMVMLNIFIGIFNLVPLLPLDGGHVAVAVYEKIRSMLQGGKRYQADVLKLMPLTYAVVGVLILIGVSSMYLDIVSPIRIN